MSSRNTSDIDSLRRRRTLLERKRRECIRSLSSALPGEMRAKLDEITAIQEKIRALNRVLENDRTGGEREPR